MTRKRPLTPEEKLLWEQVKRSAKPLKKEEEEVSLPPRGGELDRGVTPIVDKVINKLPPTPTLPHKGGGIKVIGDYAGIDRNTAERFKKGNAPMDAILDLHGLTSEKAHKSLISFINKQVKLKNRRLLVITGKGSGILQSSLPQWLNTPNISEHILAFDKATQKHGGAGAYYILLKRKRNYEQ